MAVEDGPAHIGSSAHHARLAQFNASTLASRVKELTLHHPSHNKGTIYTLPVADIEDQQHGIAGNVHGSVEIFTHTEALQYLDTAIPLAPQRTVEPTQMKAKRRDTITGSVPPNAMLWTCTLCDREMQESSKDKHLAGKAHARKLISEPSTALALPVVNCTPSGTSEVNKTKENRIAKSKSTASRQLRSWTCPSCSVVVTSRQRVSHSCSRSDPKPSTNDGPLDNFFHTYHSFHYDACIPPAISFESLQTHLQKRHKWSRKGPECKELWHRYQAALTQEFNLWFGVEDDLDAWHSLCRAVRITPLPTTNELCRLSVRGRHVNIIDLIEWGRSGGKHVRIFRTVKELSDYSYTSQKIYSKQAVDELEAGAVLKYLLRPLSTAQYWDE
ncbi:MAG: hypothetical protein LQ341_000817 [Variospora aurantia]|nr:MAG: hypothetical protein LQ341_000817 [Variospora aurantia]